MKSNSSKKRDFLSFIKPILTVCFALVVLAGVVVGFYGFRANVDINGGTQLVVDFAVSNVDIEDETELNEASSIINEILQENDVSVNSFQVQGDFGTKSFIITFEKTSQLTLQNIRLAINEEFNASETYANFVADENVIAILDDNYDLTRRTSTIDSFISSDEFLVTLSTLLFALTILMIYALFRLKLAGALSMFFAGLFDVVLTLAFIAIARVEINSYIFVVMGLALSVSVYLSADFALNIKEKMKDSQFADISTREIANMVVTENLKKNFVMTICTFVGLVIIGLISYGSIMYVALGSLVGMVVVFASHIFVMPAFFAFFNRNQEFSKLTNAMKTSKTIKSNNNLTEKKSNEIEIKKGENEIETNDEDKSAKVIEIKEDK
ncbi:MAG: hypothetical protein EOM55_01145 [Clostridia bacterium]|nr:hypothetical protein [Clostridia bacterium]